MNGCWLKEQGHAAVNEVLDPWLMLSGEEGPNPGERSKNGGLIGQLGSSLCSPGKIVSVAAPWVGRLGKQESLMLKNCEGQWQWEGWQDGSEGKGACHQALQHPHERKESIIIQQYFFALPRWEHVCIQAHTYTINERFSY